MRNRVPLAGSRLLRRLAAFGVALAVGAAVPGHDLMSAPAPLAIVPMTTIGPNGAGYMADPQLVHLAAPLDRQVVVFSGTTKAVLACAYPLRPQCFSWSGLKIDIGSLAGQIAAAGATVTNFQNVDLFQDDTGRWHAAVTIGVQTPAHPKHWTVIAHAHPTAPPDRTGVPLAWSADALLLGSVSAPQEGNYDAKYFEEDGHLYMLYVQNTVPEPALRNVIVLQPMEAPDRVSTQRGVELLAPGSRFGPLTSETYANTEAKLVEAPYLARIGGKHALIYSTGAYLTPGYKAAVAWSDTLLPPAGLRYRKVLERDTQGVWGSPGLWEVHYLIQSAQPRWPNFTGAAVIAPGVASAAQGQEGDWRLFFNGFDPRDMPPGRNGQVDATHRRPYFVGLMARVPSGGSVASASDAELATWLVPR